MTTKAGDNLPSFNDELSGMNDDGKEMAIAKFERLIMQNWPCYLELGYAFALCLI